MRCSSTTTTSRRRAAWRHCGWGGGAGADRGRQASTPGRQRPDAAAADTVRAARREIRCCGGAMLLALMVGQPVALARRGPGLSWSCAAAPELPLCRAAQGRWSVEGRCQRMMPFLTACGGRSSPAPPSAEGRVLQRASQLGDLLRDSWPRISAGLISGCRSTRPPPSAPGSGRACAIPFQEAHGPGSARSGARP